MTAVRSTSTSENPDAFFRVDRYPQAINPCPQSIGRAAMENM
jgi:hypothetical protein